MNRLIVSNSESIVQSEFVFSDHLGAELALFAAPNPALFKSAANFSTTAFRLPRKSEVIESSDQQGGQYDFCPRAAKFACLKSLWSNHKCRSKRQATERDSTRLWVQLACWQSAIDQFLVGSG